ncbi:MAG: tetratricopeptide repeat protein [Myxococcaceae bacterium]|nr:tetratricopeptide repeat protein [Myxococcaceae bacterium]
MPGERQTETELQAVIEGEPLHEDVRHETVPIVVPEGLTDETRLMVDMHLSISARLLREGSAARAFSELVRATREGPLTARLAASLARVALLAGTTAPALTIISDAVSDADDDERGGILRALARLHRRSDDLEAARERLVVLLAEAPSDRRARFVLNALLEREERWDELDASLERETRENHRRGKLRAASRTALRRARLWAERLGDPSRAALRYGQAAQYAAQADDFEGAFLLRLLWLRALHQSQAPKNVIEEAIDLSLDAGDAVGRADRVEALIQELGLRAVPGVPIKPALIDPSRRHSTQVELMAVAEAVVTKGKPEVAAILAAAVQEAPEPLALRKLEAHYVARGAWRDLAQLYRKNAESAPSTQAKLGELAKLAELLESELHDGAGAAKVYAEMVALGDGRAVAEQVRLLNAQKDVKGVRAALDESVQRAVDPKLRADALVMRADDALLRREIEAAKRDFAEALQLVPLHAAAAAGLAELEAPAGKAGSVQTLLAALKAMPKRKPGRAELYRRLARLADHPLKESKLAREAWGEVLAELPEDEEALGRLPDLCRAAGDEVQLENVLKALLKREPRGARARKAHLELVSLLERAGRRDEALEALKAAVRFEPGNRDAWLVLSDRFLKHNLPEEAAWALEHGATATESPVERMRLWMRLARVAREKLKDDAKANAFESRAEKLKRELATEMPEGPLAGTLEVPKLREGGRVTGKPKTPFDAVADDLDLLPLAARPVPTVGARPSRMTEANLPSVIVSAEAAEEDDDWEGSTAEKAPADAEALAALEDELPEDELPDDEWPEDDVSVEEAMSGIDDVVEIGTTDIEPPSAEWVAPVGFAVPPLPAHYTHKAHVPAPSPPRKTAEVPIELGDPSSPVPPSLVMSPTKVLGDERKALFERVRANPLDPDGYKLLAEHFDHAGDPTRSSLMLEIGLALEGDPNAAPRAPRLILSATDRAGLKHPSLRGEAGELLGMTGVALCRLFPARSVPREELRLDSGRGAKAAADALLIAVRILGLRAPDVYLSQDNGPPFSLIHTTEPKLLVGKLAVRKELPEAELRFFAGRALFTQNPDLLALRSLRKEQLAHGVQVLGQAMLGRGVNVEARVVRDAIPQRLFERVKQLYEKNVRKIEVQKLQEGARHSANRAGLVVCGGIAPALAALRAKKALESEILEVIRFAASERYLGLRGRRLAG